MAKYGLGQTNIAFSVLIENLDNPYNPKPLDLTGAMNAKVVFIKPDGKRVEGDAVIDGNNITYTITGDTAIQLDQRGQWQYTAEVEIQDNSRVIGTAKQVFWVV